MRARNLLVLLTLTGVARRTGRFPQLVDPRSGVNRDCFATISPTLADLYRRNLTGLTRSLPPSTLTFAFNANDIRRVFLLVDQPSPTINALHHYAGTICRSLQYRDARRKPASGSLLSARMRQLTRVGR
jgi:hypothetical protein